MPASLTPDSCEVADAEALMDDSVFFGNTALVFGALVAIFVAHVAVISAVEAYWLAQARGCVGCTTAIPYVPQDLVCHVSKWGCLPRMSCKPCT